MAILLRPKKGGTLPPASAGLDFGHPLVQGLHLYAPLNELGGQTAQDLRRGNHLRPVTGTAAWSPRGLACPSDGSLRLETARNIGISGNQKHTFGAWFLTGAETGSVPTVSHHVFNLGVATSDNASVLIMSKTTADDTFWVPTYGAWNSGHNANTGIRDGKPHLVVVVYDGANYFCYIDGRLDASAAYSTLNLTDATMAFGQYRGGGSTFGYQGRTWGAFVATRAWSQTEVEWLYTEPYAFLQPQSPTNRYWTVPSATATTVTGVTTGLALTAPAGTVSLAVAGATATLALTSPAGTVSLAVAGTATNLSLTAPAGTIGVSVAGTTASVNFAAPSGFVGVAVAAPTTGINFADPSGTIGLAVAGTTAGLTFTAPAGTITGGTTAEPTAATCSVSVGEGVTATLTVTAAGVLVSAVTTPGLATTTVTEG